MRIFAFALCALLVPRAAQAAQLTTLYHVKGTNDGTTPLAALLQVGGRFYGTTSGGGALNAGTIFKADASAGTETIVYK